MEVNTGMTKNVQEQIGKKLYHLLADTYLLYVKTHNFHWNIKGPRFFGLHKAFEEQYEELAGAVDEVAERIRALGLYVDASFEAFKKEAGLKEATGLVDEEQMIELLLSDHEHIICEARELGIFADKHADHATVDMIGRRLNVHEKLAWMLRSHL